MSTVTTPVGVASTNVYDEVYISNLDMEGNKPHFASGVWTKGKDGYILLEVTSIAWSSSASSLGVTDGLFVDFEVAGFNPEYMTQAKDTSGNVLTKYKITSPNGSIGFSGANEAKYVWIVRDGEPQGVSLNEDDTFTAARLKVYLSENNLLADPVTFSVNYALTFVDLTSTISGLSTSSSVTLSIDESRPVHKKVLSEAALSGSGYGIFKVGQVQSSTRNAPPLTSSSRPNTNDLPPIFSVNLLDGSPFWTQYTARHARTKVFSTTPKFVLYAVNQGKVGRSAENVDTVYSLAGLKLDRGASDDSATVVMDYGVDFQAV